VNSKNREINADRHLLFERRAMLELIDIHKSYEKKPLLNGVDVLMSQGETVCLLGPSGSGKSTLLRIIAGLETPEQGRVCWDGVDLAPLPVHRRGFGLVFQDYALFPHMDVAHNVAFGLKMQNLATSAIDMRVADVLSMVNLSGFDKRRVTDLSGGEQQRVALARALAPNPRLLMFDEPLGALDRNLREQLMQELRTILHASGVPAIYVTHDQEEAFTLADRVLLLHEGIIVRSGTPQQVWSDPGSVWAAQFLDAGNVVEGTILSDAHPFQVQTSVGIFELECQISRISERRELSPFTLFGGHDHSVGEKIYLLLSRRGVTCSTEGSINGIVVDVIFRQDGYKVTLTNGLDFYLPDAPRVGEHISLSISKEGIKCLA
jgi:ABC-type Fe3+/spermidine/putrescine transport system ATPase subunit